MRRLLVYVLVIAGGVLIASCMGKVSLDEWRGELGKENVEPLDPGEIGFTIKYSGTDAAGKDTLLASGAKATFVVGPDSAAFPPVYRARMNAKTGDDRALDNVLLEWAGGAFGMSEEATLQTDGTKAELKQILIDRLGRGEGLSKSETMIIGIYESLTWDEAASSIRLASADPDPSVLLALMLARVDDYECIWCGNKRVCAVNPVCP